MAPGIASLIEVLDALEELVVQQNGIVVGRELRRETLIDLLKGVVGIGSDDS